MEEIPKILQAVTWPITVLIIVFILKNPIFKLLDQTKKLKYKDFEIEFDKDLNDLNARVKEKKKKTKIPENFKNKYFNENFDIIPSRGKLIEAWLSLETSIMSSASSFDLDSRDKKLNLHEALRILNKNEILDRENLDIINELRQLRNRLVHFRESDIKEDEINKFIDTIRDQADIILSNMWNKRPKSSNKT